MTDRSDTREERGLKMKPWTGLHERAAHLGVPSGEEAMATAAAETWPALLGERTRCFLVLFVSSAAIYTERRAAIRATYGRREARHRDAAALARRWRAAGC